MSDDTKPPDGALPEPTTTPDPAPASVEPDTGVSAAQLAGLFAGIGERLDRWEQAQQDLADQIQGIGARLELIPRQVRQLGGKVDAVTESVNDPRLRDLLHNLLLLHDLLEQMRREPELDRDPADNYRVLQDQLLQTLSLNGVYQIDAESRFDPHLHKAIETRGCTDPAQDQEIAMVHRQGFRTDQAVLRYAEVAVHRYDEQTANGSNNDKEDQESRE